MRLEGAEARPAVLVRPLDALGAQSVRAELVALHRGRGDGVVPVLDVVSAPHGAGLLRAHLVGPRLGAVLAERERWAAGEVVTVLGSLVDTVARLHRCGVAHGGVSAAEPVIADGRAVLVDFERAELFAADAPEALLARTPAVGTDRDAIRSIATDLLRRVDGPRARAAQQLAEETALCSGAQLLGMLRAGLDELAAPVPLRAADADPPSTTMTSTGERLLPVVRDDAGGEPEPNAPSEAASVPQWARQALGALRRRLDALPSMRRRIIVAGGAALCAAAVLLALPGGGAGEHTTATADAEGRHPDDAVRPSVTETARAASGAGGAAIAGDDPLAAAVALLERRAHCFAELSLLCLEEVGQQGSAALMADRAAMTALRAGDEATYLDVDPVEPRLVERLGAGALVELGPRTAPASLLLMRSEAGWRIRDWVAVGGD